MTNNDYSSWTKSDFIEEIKKLKRHKKYGLVWDEEAKDNAEHKILNNIPILKEVISNHIISDKLDPNHVLIEGDNYHSLSVLNYTHKGKVDAIYIDPPYNTGDHWKYNNRYVDLNDTFRHSKWISFMTKRLQLAKSLLTSSGIICITIDNHELHNLRHIMEIVFPNKEIITTVIEHNFRGRIKNNFALTHEYALWAVNKGADLITRSPEMGKDICRNLRRTGNNSKRADSPTMFYGIEVEKKSLKIIAATQPLLLEEKIPTHKNLKTEMIWPIDSNDNERNWYYSSKKMLSEAKKGECFAKIINNKIQIHYHIPGKLKRRKSVWRGPKYDASTYGSELLTEIIGENNFPFPKSIHAVKECILAMTTKKDAVILDFFAGSGTTGHAVLELNKEDGGNRTFLLCTNNEGNICSEITLPRLRNVIKGYKFNGSDKTILTEKKLTYSVFKNSNKILDEIETIAVEHNDKYNKFERTIDDTTIKLIGHKEIHGHKSGLGGNLLYFQTHLINSTPTDRNKRNIVSHITEILCLKENCFELKKSNNKYAIFAGLNGNYLGIIYYYDGIDLFKNYLKNNQIKKINTYVFTHTGYIDQNEFADVASSIILMPMPHAILNTYQKIFKTRT